MLEDKLKIYRQRRKKWEKIKNNHYERVSQSTSIQGRLKNAVGQRDDLKRKSQRTL